MHGSLEVPKLESDRPFDRSRDSFPPSTPVLRRRRLRARFAAFSRALLATLAIAGAAACGDGSSRSRSPEPASPNSGTTGAPASAPGVPPGATPEEVVRALLDAGPSGDPERFLAFLTKAARKALTPAEGEKWNPSITPPSDPLENAEIGKAIVEGDRAKLYLLGKRLGRPAREVVLLRRDEGEWRISGAGPVEEGKPEFVLEFEVQAEMARAMAEAFKSAATDPAADGAVWSLGRDDAWVRGELALFESLVSMDADAYERGWRRSIRVEDEPAGDAIARLGGELGFELDSSGYARELARKITLSLEDVSLASAIERLSLEVGLVPRYRQAPARPAGPVGEILEEASGELDEATSGLPDAFAEAHAFSRLGTEPPKTLMPAPGDPTPEPRPWAREGDADAAPETGVAASCDGPCLGFEPAPPDYRSAGAGPFVVAVDRIEVEPPWARGDLALVAIGSALPQGLLSLNDPPRSSIRALSPDGIDRSRGPSWMWNDPLTSTTLARSTLRKELRGITREMDRLSTVTATVAIRLPEEVVAVRFDSIESGRSIVQDGLTVALGEVTDSTLSLRVEGLDDSNEQGRVHALIRDRKGVGIRLQPRGFPFQGKWEEDFQTPDRPPDASLEVKVVRRIRVVEYTATIRDVPIPDHDKLPETIPPLEFGDHSAPCSVEFLALVGEPDEIRARVAVANHSNRDIESITTRYQVESEAGKRPREGYLSIQGQSQGQAPLLVPVAGRVEREERLFPSPGGDFSGPFEVDRVVFMDGEEWKRPREK